MADSKAGGRSQPVNHFTDGRNALGVGGRGFLARRRAALGTAAITILTTGTPWWGGWDIPESVTLDPKILILVLVLTTGGFLAAAMAYLRWRTKRSLDLKYHMHQLAHDIRDRNSALQARLSHQKSFSRGKLQKELQILLTDVCEDTSDYFSRLTGDNSIAAAIRILRFDQTTKVPAYRTYARSKGLNKKRKETSEDIPFNEGIPRFLREHGAQGILRYNDLEAAAAVNAYKETKNDRRYPDDVASMVVAPLNAWVGSGDDMIGILYITSRKKRRFNVTHVDAVGFLADITAMAISNAIFIVNSKCSDPDPSRGKDYAQNL